MIVCDYPKHLPKVPQFDAYPSKEFTRYIEIHPTLAAGYFWRGKAEYRNGRLDAAYADLKAAIKLHPRDVKSQVLLIGTLQQLGRDNELQAQLKVTERLNPDVRSKLDSMLAEVVGRGVTLR